MEYSKITGKDQITLPKAVRERLDVQRGDTIGFELRRIDGKDVVVVEPVRTRDALAWFGALRPARPVDPLVETREGERALAKKVVQSRHERRAR